jgi:threonylcarbamoyladenosine tRNA methylthiotransferase MtaB
VVSCTVTKAADGKCRKLVRRLRRENPRSLVVVCGCSAQKMTEAEREALGIDIVVGNRLKHRIPELVSDWYESGGKIPLPVIYDDDLMNDTFWDPLFLDKPRMHTRAFLKVQDGCSHFCTYCIVPFVRGRPVFKEPEDALEEAKTIVASGCPEIVLTGVHLGLHKDLPRLVRMIGAIKGLKRLRFGSIEPFAVGAELLEALIETEKFCKHLHIPLQSGDDRVLSEMRRGYTSDEFRKIVDSIRKKLGDDMHLSTDLMVGFPGEDEGAFLNSIKLLTETGFGKIHVFNYSPRKGTKAYLWDRPGRDEVKQRLSMAHETAESAHREYCSKWIGRDVDILVEERSGNVVRGLTRNYIRTEAFDERVEVGEEITVRAERYVKDILVSGLGVGYLPRNGKDAAGSGF